MQTQYLFLVVISLFACLQSGLKAQVITPVSASASSVYDADRAPINLINGSGLVPNSGNILTNTHNADNSALGMWHAQGDGTAGPVNAQWVAFDLGANNFSVTAADIWQMNQPGNLGRGVNHFAIYTSPTANVADATNFVGNYSLAIGPGANGELVQNIPFSASGVRLIKFAIIDDWNGKSTDPDYVGLAEVRFEGAVPQVAILSQPVSTTNLLGESHTFSATATGPAPLSYQWYKSPGTPISGATNSSYTIGLVDATSDGGYYVVVTNSTSSATSSVASLTVLNAFAVTPVSATASSFYDAVEAPVNLINGNGQSGPNEIFNQTANAHSGALGMWHTDGTTVNGAWAAFDLGATYTLSSADIWEMNQPGNLGRGVKDFAIYTSPTANVADATNFVGNFSLAEAGGTNGEPVQRFSISASNVRLVQFVIADDWNGADPDYTGLSEVRFEGLITAAQIGTQPLDSTNLLGESHTFSVTAAGPPPLSYQWYQSPNTPISGATNSSYTIGFVSDASAGGYYVVVTNLTSSVTSSVANLTVLDTYAVTPVAASASSSTPGFGPNFLIDHSSQVGPNEIFNQVAGAHNDSLGMWYTAGPTNVNGSWVAFDLGAQYTLSSADIWQMNNPGNLGYGVNNFAIYTSSTTNVNDATNFVGNYSLALGTGNVGGGAPLQRLSISATNARLVKFVIADNWNGADPDYVGLSEVRFEGAAPCGIALQPQSSTNLLTETHTFSVTAAGSPPISYQWYDTSSGAIPNATGSSLSLGPINSTSIPGYYVVISNLFNAATSSVATVTVVNAYPVTPVSATASSFFSANQNPIVLINGLGQSGSNEIFNQTANASNDALGMWHTDGTTVNGAWAAFDLGAQYTLSSADVWQFNQGNNLGRGVKDFAIYTSPTANVADATNFVGNFSLAEAGGVNGEPVQRFLISVSHVRLVKLVVADDWNGADPDYTGLSEVRFEAQALSPLIKTFGITGGALSLSVQGGMANGPWTLLQSTNVATPLGQWQAVASGAFDALGNLSTNILNTTSDSQSFFILKVQ